MKSIEHNKKSKSRWVLARELAVFLVLASVQAYLMCARCSTSYDYARVVAFTYCIWIFLWKGNSILARFLSDRISWIDFPAKRFFVGIIVTITYTLVAMYLIMKFFEWAVDFNFGRGFMMTIYFSIVITILISFFLHGRHFLMYWRQATIEKQKFEKESIAARYESLKNQVNPHFLFNSLNALTNLVYEDRDKAVKFIKQLSEVYRYVLDTRDREVVPIGEELDFLRSFIFLQQIRFGEKLRIEIHDVNRDAAVTPLAL